MKKILRKYIYIFMITVSFVSLSSGILSKAYAATVPGSNSSWQSATNLPQVVNKSTSVNYHGFIYSIGGEGSSSNNLTNIAPIAGDGSLGAWTTSPKLLPAGIAWHASVIVKNYIYAMGGYGGGSGIVDTVYYTSVNSDGSINDWKLATNLPQALYGSSAVTFNNYIYMIGGWNSSFFSSDTVYYTSVNSDGSIDSWKTATHLPVSLSDIGSTQSNGYIYVAGGVNNVSGMTYSDKVYYSKINSDGSIGDWNASTHNLPLSLFFPQIQAYHGYIFSVGGDSDSTGTIASVYSAPLSTDGSIGDWTVSPNPLPKPISHSTSSVYNGVMYLIGGSTNTGFSGLDNVYYSTLAGYDAPILQSITSSLAFGSSNTFDLFSLASNNPSQQSLIITSSPSHGSISISNGTITYTANTGYIGSDSLTYSFCYIYDSTNCSQAIITLNITRSIAIAPKTGFGIIDSNKTANKITYLGLSSFSFLGLGFIVRIKSGKI